MNQIQGFASEEKSRKVKLNLSPNLDSDEAILPPIVVKPILELKVPIVIRKPKTAAVPSRCNYTLGGNSRESIITPIPGNWTEPQPRGTRDHPSISEAQTDCHSKDEEAKSRAEFDDDESLEGVLPRTFFPLGVDWDSRLEDLDYGKDVSVQSFSSSSEDSIFEPNLDDFTSVAEWIRQNIRPQAAGRSDDLFTERSESSSLSISTSSQKKRVMLDTGPPGIIKCKSRQELSFLSHLKEIKRKERHEKIKNDALQKHYKELNLEIRTLGQSMRGGEWKTNDSDAQIIMEKALTDVFESKDEMHTLLTIHCQKICNTYDEYTELLAELVKELNFIDQEHKKVLQLSFFDQFVHENQNETQELILKGKDVEEHIKRRLQDFDLAYICQYLLSKPNNIIYLDLCYNCVTMIGLRILTEFLSWDKRIIGLNLMNNNIEALDSRIIDAAVENKTLKSLRLNGNPLGKKGGEYISFLLMFKNLEHLDIAQTDQTLQSVAWINQALLQCFSLKVLDLSRILGYTGYTNDSQYNSIAFSDILRLNTSLVELHLQKNNLIDADMEQLVFGLSFSRKLELLDLNFNRIGNQGAELLAGSLTRGGPLKALMLSGNMIGDLGARALSLKLPSSDITLLDISYNQIKDQGIIDLIRNPKLLAFFIFGNQIGSKALRIIQKQLSNGSLNPDSVDVVLTLSGNGVITLGRNGIADRYRARYYHDYYGPVEDSTEVKRFVPSPCSSGYLYHNNFQTRSCINTGLQSRFGRIEPICLI